MTDQAPTRDEIDAAMHRLPARVAAMLLDLAAEPDRQLILSGVYHPSTRNSADRRGLIYPMPGGEHRLTLLGEEVARRIAAQHRPVAAELRARADELDGAPASAEVDPCAGLKVGDEYRENTEECLVENPATLQLCSRPAWHPGNHVHAQWGEVLAIWPQVSA